MQEEGDGLSLTMLPGILVGTSVTGLRVLVQSLLASIPGLFNVAALLGFVFFLFGIFSLQVRRL